VWTDFFEVFLLVAKCVSCGYENEEPNVCGQCGKPIRHFVKKLTYHGEDMTSMAEEVSSGNFVIVELDEWFAQTFGTRSPEDIDDEIFENLFFNLARIAEEAGGEFYPIGKGMFALAPAPFRFWKEKPQHSKVKKHTSKQEETKFLKCPFCGASVKAGNLEDHASRVHHVEIGKDAVPSAGTLARFFSKHANEAKKLLDEAEKTGELAEFKEQVKGMAEQSPFALRACETGQFGKVILSLERLKDEIGGDETARWARSAQLEVLCQLKPKFEEEKAIEFYGKVCKTCKRIDKEESQCQEGFSNCMYDEAFEEFEREEIEKYVNSLKNERSLKESS
jgi:hypothetical protein